MYEIYLLGSRALVSWGILLIAWGRWLFGERPQTQRPVPEVMVVGGGFAGVLAARAVAEGCQAANVPVAVTLVDPKAYFEYTPAVLRALADPAECGTILLPFKTMGLSVAGVALRQARLVGVDPQSGAVRLLDGTREALYTPRVLLIATGTPYATAAVRDWDSATFSQRRTRLHEDFERLRDARCVVIAGGATSGVELAGEVATVVPPRDGDHPREVILVSASDRLLPCSPLAASSYAERQLRHLGVQVLLGETAVRGPGRTLALASGRTLECDALYVCAVASPPAIPGLPMRPGGLPVNRFLHVEGRPALFAAGDAMDAPKVCGCGSDRCGKSAYIAEMSAKVAAENIVRTLRGVGSLTPFPEKLPTLECVSLGHRDGLVILNSVVIPGWIAVPGKLFIKLSKLDDLRGGLLGRAIWTLLDTASPLLSLIAPADRPPPPPPTTDGVPSSPPASR